MGGGKHHAITVAIFASAFLLSAFEILPSKAAAQIEWKDRIVTVARLDQGNHAIALPTRAEYTLVVWEDWRAGDAQTDIYAQLIDNTSGFPLWDADGIPVCTATGDQRNPRVVYDTLGGAIIVWEDFRTGYGYSELFAHRLILASGVLDPAWSGTPDGVSVCVGTGASASHPRIVGTGEGAYIVWEDARNKTVDAWNDNRDIYLTYLLSATGMPPQQGCQLAVWQANGNQVTTDTSAQRKPEIALDNVWRSYCGVPGVDQLGALIVYEDDRPHSPGNPVWNLYAQDWGRDGLAVGIMNELALAPFPAGQSNVRLATTGGVPGGSVGFGVPCYGVVAVWEDERNDPTNHTTDIYAQLIDPDNTPFLKYGSSGYPVCLSTGGQHAPAVAVVDKSLPAQSTAIVAWEDERNYGSSKRIFIRTCSSSGALPL